MEVLIAFLPVLVCPILMVVLVWMMNRQEMQQIGTIQPQKSLWSDLWHLALCCVNPIVVGGLALVGTGLYWVSPETLWRFAPTLVMLIFPISMLLTMRNMNEQAHQSRPSSEMKENR